MFSLLHHTLLPPLLCAQAPSAFTSSRDWTPHHADTLRTGLVTALRQDKLLDFIQHYT